MRPKYETSTGQVSMTERVIIDLVFSLRCPVNSFYRPHVYKDALRGKCFCGGRAIISSNTACGHQATLAVKCHLCSLYVKKHIHPFQIIWPTVTTYFHAFLMLPWLFSITTTREPISLAPSLFPHHCGTHIEFLCSSYLALCLDEVTSYRPFKTSHRHT